MKMQMTGLVVAALLAASAATAQAASGQGGYLGLNPGATQQSVIPTVPTPPPLPSIAITHADQIASPSAWCGESPDPAHCRGRAANEHAICRDKGTYDAYDACRRVVDQMHNTK
jgi:hypothetical protein